MKSSTFDSFGEALASYRIEQSLSQQALATKLGMRNRRSIAGWERHERLPKNREIVLKLIQIFHLNKEDAKNFLLLAEMNPSYETKPPDYLPESIEPHNLPYIALSRSSQVREVLTKLLTPETGTLVLTGISGIGKSTLAHLIYRTVNDEISTNSFPFIAAPIWIGLHHTSTIITLIASLLRALEKRPPDFNTMLPEQLVDFLFDALTTSDTLPRLIVIDQFELLLDVKTGDARADREGVNEFIRALHSRRSRCHFLVTSRIKIQEQGASPPIEDGYLQTYKVKNLTIDEGVEFFQKKGVIAETSKEAIQKAIELCQWHPHTLTLLAAYLENQKLGLTEFLIDEEFFKWKGDTATKLLNSIYLELTSTQKYILQVLSLCREPVPHKEIPRFLPSSIFAPQLRHSLDALSKTYLVEIYSNNHYFLHGLVSDYIYKHFVKSDMVNNKQIVIDIHLNIGNYYQRKISHSKDEGEELPMNSIKEAVYHLSEAEKWNDAFIWLKQERAFWEYKFKGNPTLLRDLYLPLLPLEKWHPTPQQAIELYYYLAIIYGDLADWREGIFYFERAYEFQKMQKDYQGMVNTLIGLTWLHGLSGSLNRAQAHAEQALYFSHFLENRLGEIAALNNLGWVRKRQGSLIDAEQCYQSALEIVQNVTDQSEDRFVYEERTLRNIGDVAILLGKPHEALEPLNHALTIALRHKFYGGEGATRHSIGRAYTEIGDYERALIYLKKALEHSRERNDQGGESLDLNRIGEVYSKLGDRDQAFHFYKEAIIIQRRIRHVYEEGRSLLDIGIFVFENQAYEVALAFFLKAKNCFLQFDNASDLGVIESWINTTNLLKNDFSSPIPLEEVSTRATILVELTLGISSEIMTGL